MTVPPIGRLLTAAGAVLALAAVAPAPASAGICAPADCQDAGPTRSIVAAPAPVAAGAAARGGARRDRPTSLTVTVARAARGAGRPKVRIAGPRGYRRVISRTTTIRRARPGRWRVVATPIRGRETVTYATTHVVRVDLRRHARAKVRVRYAQQVAATTRIASPDAFRSVTAAPGGRQEVVLQDPGHEVKPGTVLTAGAGPETPDGVLLEVKDVERDGATATVVGEPAPLTAIGPAADIRVRPELVLPKSLEARAASPLARGAAAADDAEGEAFDEPFECEAGAEATVEGSIEFSAQTDMGIAWGGFWEPLTIRAHARADFREAARLAVELKGRASCELDLELLKKDYEFKAITFTVGPVPVVIVPKLNFKLTGEAEIEGTIETWVEQEAKASVGVEWDGEKLVPIAEAGNAFDYQLPDLTVTASAKAAIGPKLSFELYGIAGPYLTAGAYGKFERDPDVDPEWKLAAGLEAGAGLKFKVWTFDFDEGVPDLFDKEWILAQSPEPPSPDVTTERLPVATQGAPYAAELAVNPLARAPLTFEISAGALPDGLRIDEATGRISGTPTGGGRSTFTVLVKDRKELEAERELTLDVATPPAAITTTALPGATALAPYSLRLAAAGSSRPYRWTASGVPAGMTVDAGGVLSGTPDAPGTHTIALRVTGGDGKVAERRLALTVAPAPLSIATTALPFADRGWWSTPLYSTTIAPRGGRAPYRFALASGSLPTGLSLDAASGRISGYPGADGRWSFAIRVTDADNRAATRSFTIEAD